MKCRIYIVPFELDTRKRLDVNDVIRIARREMRINSPESDPCTIAWKNLGIDALYRERLAHSDLRVVFLYGQDIFAFDKTGTQGFVNGKPVEFDRTVTKWFLKFISKLEN